MDVFISASAREKICNKNVVCVDVGWEERELLCWYVALVCMCVIFGDCLGVVVVFGIDLLWDDSKFGSVCVWLLVCCSCMYVCHLW